jgi:hypothetical protein
MPRYAHILSTGRYVPEKMLPNSYFNEILGRDVDEWLVKNVGIRERHVMAPDESTSDLAYHASRQALERAGLQSTDLDLILVATDTPDYLSPGTSSVLQGKLGATQAGTFDVNCACAGWATAMETAARFIGHGSSSETHSLQIYAELSFLRRCSGQGLNGVFGVKHPISTRAAGCFGGCFGSLSTGSQHDISTVKFVKDISLKMNHASRQRDPLFAPGWRAGRPKSVV